jgi:acetyltransferase-like isoleucine patch superfamily enzyme
LKAEFSSAKKQVFSKRHKLLSLLISFVDPGNYVHMLRRVNFYYYQHVLPLRRIKLGENSHISPFAVFHHPQRIEIGRNVRIGDRVYLWAGHETARIIIGDDVMLGPDVMINTSTYRYQDGSPIWAQAMDEADIVVGDDVWIGARAMLMPGAKIGAGSVIGAGAVVQGEIPPMSIALGMPARVVLKRQITPEPAPAQDTPKESATEPVKQSAPAAPVTLAVGR